MLCACHACLCGCTPSKKQVKVYPVSGQVIYDNKPAVGVHVFFAPTSAPTIPSIPANPRGFTDTDGKFSLTTYTSDDGAAEGGYQVILLWPPESGEEEQPDEDRFLGWYNAVHSKLAVEVKGEVNVLPPFRLPVRTRPPAAIEGVPGKN